MKRLVMAVVVTGIAAAAFAAWGLAAPAGSTTAAGPATADKTRLPALPAEVRQRRRWIVGVKCDAPPFGYINVRGQNAGFDVEIARWFSRYAFGRDNRVTFECAPTPAREPLLTTGRVDLVISTFTYTTDRDTRIDFSRAYYRASGRLLVKNNSSIQRLNDISGKRVATTSGSIYDRWVRRCFPNTELTVTDSFTNALLAFNQGRADTLMWDDSVLVGIGDVVLLADVVKHQHVRQGFEAVREVAGHVDRREVVVADVLAERLARLAVERDDARTSLQADEEIVLSALVEVQAADRALTREGDVRLADRLRQVCRARDLDEPPARIVEPAQRDEVRAFGPEVRPPRA